MNTKTERLLDIEDRIYEEVSAAWVVSHAGVVQTRDEADKDYHTNFNRLVSEALAADAEYVSLK